MRIRSSVLLLAAACCLITACQTNTTSTVKPDTAGPVKPLPKIPEGVIRVQHILIGFKGSVRGKDVQRTMAEAGQLAQELLAKAKEGADFDALVKENTDDSAPGIYTMSDIGVDTMLYTGNDLLRRSEMVKSFGDVSFQLKVGEVGLAEYNVLNSPFGWHVIKRLE